MITFTVIRGLFNDNTHSYMIEHSKDLHLQLSEDYLMILINFKE